MELRKQVQRLPRSPGVYLWRRGDDVLYVGKATDLRGRATNYFTDEHPKTRRLMAAVDGIEYIAVRNEKEALLLEQTLIKRHKPRYNVRLTDDKQYPYLKLTSDAYPRLVKVHRYEDDGATYFGPFPDGYGAFHVMQALNDAFPLRRCRTLPAHKCLYYDIGKCVAPCIDACTDEEYASIVAEVRDVLRGRSRRLLRRFEEDMQAAAKEHRFEEAARLRDQLRGLQGVLERQHMVQDQLQDRDIAAIDVRGDMAVVSVLHQRDGKVVGQSAYTLSGVDAEAPDAALAGFLRGHYADRPVPRYITAELGKAVADGLEIDLRLLAGRAVGVETPRKGDKRRWVEVAAKNAALRAEEERIKRERRGMGAVEALDEALGLPAPPRVIEGFDVSHHGGHHTRAALVRFVDGEPDKQGYRTFGMRTVGVRKDRGGQPEASTRLAADAVDDATVGGNAEGRGTGREVDDYASIREAVARRYRRLREEGADLPDLLLVDGGRGQLDAARQGLGDADVDLPVAALAKRDEEVHLPTRLRPLRLDRRHAGLQLLQRVRDEAHRFGITQVRKKASRGVTGGPLEQVPGIGPARRRELVRAFGGLEGLRAASAEDLQRVPGVTAQMAAQVVEVLRARVA